MGSVDYLTLWSAEEVETHGSNYNIKVTHR